MGDLADAAIPEKMQAVQIGGTGFESIRVVELPVPQPNDKQVLCRVDACTVCPSILKLIAQGAKHNFLKGWDLGKYPVTLGDEGAVTVVRPGRDLVGRFRAGERLAIQPAVDHEPINHRERYSDAATMKKTAVGYTLGGTFAEYLLVQEEVIEAGCLVKLPADDLGHYEVSLSEPLSCVVSAQDHHVHLVPDPETGERKPQKGLLKGGVTVIFGAGVMGRFHVELALTYEPRAIVILTRSAERFDWLREHVEPRAKTRGVLMLYEKLDLERLPGILQRLTGQAFADDIIDTTASPKVVEAAANTLAGRGSVIDTFGGLNIGEHTVPVDLRKVHYDESVITGSSGGNPFDTKRTLDLIHGGYFDVGTQIRKVGSLKHAAGFLQLIKDKKIDGKALIYPHTRLDAPLDTPDGWSRQREKEHLAKNTSDISGG